MTKTHKGPALLGQKAGVPASPDEAELDIVPNPHPGRNLSRAVRRARIHVALPCDRPARFRPSRHRLRAGRMAHRVEIAEALFRQLPQSRRLPRGLHRARLARILSRRSRRNGFGSAAIGIRAAAFQSMCSGRRARRLRAYGFLIKACRPIAGAGEGSALSPVGRTTIILRRALKGCAAEFASRCRRWRRRDWDASR